MRTAALTIAAVLGSAAPAGAQATSSATPNTAGSATTLRFDVDAAVAPMSGRIPAGLSMSAPPGFKLNAKAFPRRCSKVRAQLNECTATSRLGAGTLGVQITTPQGTSVIQRGLVMYLGRGGEVWAIVEVFGKRAVGGRVDTTNGLRISFDPLPSLPAFEGVTYVLQRVSLDVGGTHRIRARTVVRARRSRKRRIVVRTRREPVLRAPATCTGGSWPASVAFRFADGSVTTLPAPTPCRAA